MKECPFCRDKDIDHDLRVDPNVTVHAMWEYRGYLSPVCEKNATGTFTTDGQKVTCVKCLETVPIIKKAIG